MDVCAVCHVHSSWSYDGSWSISDLAAQFVKRGCRVMMVTEHDRGYNEERFQLLREACDGASSAGILVVPGIEYSDSENRVHVLVWGLDTFLGEGLPTTEMLRAAKAANGVAVLAHPSRKAAWQVFEPEWTDLLTGIEIWNRKYDGWAPSNRASALIEASHLVPFVGLDFHTDRQLFPLEMAVTIDGQVTDHSVIGALRSGNCEARVFSRSLDSGVFRAGAAALRIAEYGRRNAASTVRSARAAMKIRRSSPVG